MMNATTRFRIKWPEFFSIIESFISATINIFTVFVYPYTFTNRPLSLTSKKTSGWLHIVSIALTILSYSKVSAGFNDLSCAISSAPTFSIWAEGFWSCTVFVLEAFNTFWANYFIRKTVAGITPWYLAICTSLFILAFSTISLIQIFPKFIISSKAFKFSKRIWKSFIIALVIILTKFTLFRCGSSLFIAKSSSHTSIFLVPSDTLLLKCAQFVTLCLV